MKYELTEKRDAVRDGCKKPRDKTDVLVLRNANKAAETPNRTDLAIKRLRHSNTALIPETQNQANCFKHCDEIIYNTYKTIQSAKPVRQANANHSFIPWTIHVFFPQRASQIPIPDPLGIKRPSQKIPCKCKRAADPSSSSHHQ